MITSHRRFESGFRIVILKNNEVIADPCTVAVGFLSRLKGLIGVTSMRAGQGMLFPDCSDVHMWWMSVAIDIVFLKKVDSSSWEIIDIIHSAKPWSLLPFWRRRADDVLEVSAGTCVMRNLSVGDKLVWSNSQS